MSSELMVQVKGLEKTYDGEVPVRALRGANLSVPRGEFLAVVGPSGSGKSTLFNVLGGLAAPTAGEVWIDGVDLRGMSESERTQLRQQKIGFVFQRYNLLPTLTANDNISLAQSLAGRAERPAGFDEILRQLNIDQRLSHRPRALSGGEQQRIAIARALVNQPALLLADEPTGNLDSENSEAVLQILRKLNQDLGQTILMITHNPEAAEVADRIIKMRDGRILS